MAKATLCPRCHGPNDILHTARECDDLAGLSGLDGGERYELCVIANIIERAGSPLAAAAELRANGWLRGS